nr:hypothetical protein [Gemmatimonadaceae bacterium]
DLLPYLPFDAEKAEAHVREVNPIVPILRTSATTGEGLEAWYDWLRARVAGARRLATQPAGA